MPLIPSYDLESTLMLLHDPRWHWRVTAAARLEDFQDSRAVQALIAALADPNAAVRATAVDALLTSGEMAFEPLLEALASLDDMGRCEAAYALGRFKNPRAVDALIQLLDDSATRVRVAAIRTLSEFDDARIFGLLIPLLNDPDLRIRASAVDALGEIRDPRAGWPLLDTLLRDPAPFVRLTAQGVLTVYFDAVTPLMTRLADPSAWVQLLAAHLLEILNTPEARQAVAEWRQKRANGESRAVKNPV